jgi:plasmid stabilization system protein ParE
MRILVLPSALDDLADGFDFYEQQEKGLGDYFQESLFSDIESLRLYAGIHPRRFGLHRVLARRFPYAIYYDKEGATIRVWAVVDCRRDPRAIRKKMAAFRRNL